MRGRRHHLHRARGLRRPRGLARRRRAPAPRAIRSAGSRRRSSTRSGRSPATPTWSRSSASPSVFPNTLDSVLAPSDQRERGPDAPPEDADQHGRRGAPRLPGRDQRVVQAREPAPRVRSRASTQLARKYVDRMAELGGACDFALDVARYYPLQVIMSILGVPESDEPLHARAHAEALRRRGPRLRRRRGPRRAAWRSSLRLIQYFAAHDRATGARSRASDLASAIANADDRRRAARRPRDDRLLRDRRDGRPRHDLEHARRRARGAGRAIPSSFARCSAIPTLSTTPSRR